MRPYFEKMADFGRELKKGQRKQTAQNRAALEAAEAEIQAQIDAEAQARIMAVDYREPYKGLLTQHRG